VESGIVEVLGVLSRIRLIADVDVRSLNWDPINSDLSSNLH